MPLYYVRYISLICIGIFRSNYRHWANLDLGWATYTTTHASVHINDTSNQLHTLYTLIAAQSFIKANIVHTQRENHQPTAAIYATGRSQIAIILEVAHQKYSIARTLSKSILGKWDLKILVPGTRSFLRPMHMGSHCSEYLR